MGHLTGSGLPETQKKKKKKKKKGHLGLDVVRDGRVLDSSASIGLFVLIEAEATDM